MQEEKKPIQTYEKNLKTRKSEIFEQGKGYLYWVYENGENMGGMFCPNLAMAESFAKGWVNE